MIKNKKILIVGAGGFIGGHLVNRLLKDGNSIVACDIKPKEYWFQDFENSENCYKGVLPFSCLLEPEIRMIFRKFLKVLAYITLYMPNRHCNDIV